MSAPKKRLNTTASARLRQDYMRIKNDPVPYIIGAEPLPANILEWHYVVKGPEKSLYDGGFYHGKLVFPKEFPFKPPKIIMITPNGRFKTHTRLCLSISDFHPDTWNPAWSVSTILTGLLSFMLEKAPTLGSIETTDYQTRDMIILDKRHVRLRKKQYALNSLDFNIKDELFCELFPDITNEIKEILKKRSEQNEESEFTSSSTPLNGDFRSVDHDNFMNGSIFANMCVFIGFAIFALTVHYVLKAVSPDEMG